MYDHHEQISLLLPWYVNGTLDNDELQRVGQHLDNCLVCRKQLGQLQLAASIIKQSDPFTVSPRVSFAKISTALERPRTAIHTGLHRRLIVAVQRLLADSIPPQLLWALPALLLSVLILHAPPVKQTPAFRTLTDAAAPHLVPLRLSIGFDKNISLRELDEIVGGYKGRIIDGPSADAVYIVEFPVYSRAAQDNMLLALQSSQQIKRIERIH